MLDDRLIDDVARELTAAEPHSTLRARVTSALDGKRQSARWRIIAPATVAAGAALAVAVNALLAWQTRSQPVPAEISAQRVAAPGAPLADAGAPWPSTPRAAAPVAVSHPGGATSPEAVAPPAEELAWQSRAVPPLAPPASPALGGQPADAVAPLLDVAPLVTEALELAPLDEIDPVATGGA